MDALSAVLAPVRLQRTRWASTSARAPWGLTVPASTNCVRFHYMVRGKAWLDVDDADDPDVELSTGDLAVLPLGHGHALRDHPETPARSWDDVVTCATWPNPGVLHLALGPPSTPNANAAETSFITGAFVLDDPLATPLMAALPSLIRLAPDADRASSCVESLRFITREVQDSRAGAEIVLLRMADVMLIQILRAYLESVPEHGGGYLGALRDPSTAAAISAMHRRSEEPWTVGSLAEEVGLSRSVFAARFTQLVGEPPLGYLTRIRMQRAAALLRDGATLTKASRLTGYASNASFSHAFRQWSGTTPGAWRRRLRPPPESP